MLQRLKPLNSRPKEEKVTRSPHKSLFQPERHLSMQLMQVSKRMRETAEKAFVKLWYPEEHKWLQFASRCTAKMQSAVLKGSARTPRKLWSPQIKKEKRKTLKPLLSADLSTSAW